MRYLIKDLDKHTIGYDYEHVKRDHLTGRLCRKPERVECKAGHHSKLSKRQKEMQEKYGKRYKVKRKPFR